MKRSTDTKLSETQRHNIARRLIRPELNVSAVYIAIREHLEKLPGTPRILYAPCRAWRWTGGLGTSWLNAAEDQVFVKGEVIACEAGLYSPALGGGIRLERNSLVTADEPITLDNFQWSYET